LSTTTSVTAISIVEKLKTDNRNTNVFTVKTFLKEFGCSKTVIPYTHSQLDLEVAVTISTLQCKHF